MDFIDYRAMVKDAAYRLLAAYSETFLPGAIVSYSHGEKSIEVEIVEQWGANRAWVRNPKTGRRYLLEYDAIDKVITPAPQE